MANEPTQIIPAGVNTEVSSPSPVEITPTETPSNVETPSIETPSTEEKTIDFSEFLNKKDVIQKKDDNIPAVLKTTVPAPKIDARDFSDLDPELAPFFKQMSNDSFNRLKPIILEHKKQKEALALREQEVAKLKEGRLPDHYYEHPEGYKLDPEFAEASAKTDVANTIVQHWREQLRKIRQGAVDYDHLYINNEGRYAMEKRSADASAEGDIMLYYNNAQHEMIRERQKTEDFVKTFSDKHGQTKNWVTDFESKAFSLFDKEEGKSLKLVVDDTLKAFPSALRNSIGARLLAKSLVTNQQLVEALRQVSATKATPATAKAEDKTKAGPTGAETMSGSSGKSNGDDITIEDFEKFKAGIL
jgi:hypothetical protein